MTAPAIGPTLGDTFAVTGALPNPRIDLYRGSVLVATNTNWASALSPGRATQAALLSGAFPLRSTVADSAVRMTLAPGAYTAIVSGVAGSTGVAIMEVFEVDGFTVPLINIATRGKVLTGADVMIGGFIIQGSGPGALGQNGSGLGFQGIPNSVAVKFSVFQYAGDPSGNTTGVFTNGQNPVGGVNLNGTGINLNAAKQNPGFKAQNNTLAVYTNTYEIAKFAARLDYEHAVAAAQPQPSFTAAAPVASPGA